MATARRSQSNPSIAKYQILGFNLAAGTSRDIDLSGYVFAAFIVCTDAGGATTGLQMRLGREGDEMHVIQGDVFKSGYGFDKMFLRNTNVGAVSGKLLLSNDPGFDWSNPFTGPVR